MDGDERPVAGSRTPRASVPEDGTAGLADGTYDAFVVWAEPIGGAPDALTVDLTIVSGPHKGDVVSLTAQGLAVDAMTLTGLPCTLVVHEGQPALDAIEGVRGGAQGPPASS